MYSEDQTVDHIVLMVINDGAGNQCGMSYKRRCEAAVFGADVLSMYGCAKRANEWLIERDCPSANKAQLRAAAQIIADYYAQHVIEERGS